MLIHTFKRALEQAKLGLSRHRLDLLCKLLPTLIQTRSVNLRKLACAFTGPDENRQPVSSIAAVFQPRPLPECFYPTNRRPTGRCRATAAVSFGSDALAVGPDRSESALLRAGVSRRINPVDILVAATTRQLPYARTQTSDATGTCLFKRLDLLSISRPRIHGQRLVSLSAAATRRFFCDPYSRQRLGAPRRWATALPSVDDPLLETRDDRHVLQCHALPIAALESRRPSPPQRRAAVTGDPSIRSRQHRDRLGASLVYRNRLWVSQIQRLPLGRNPIDPAPKTAPSNRSTRGRAPMVSAPWTARA